VRYEEDDAVIWITSSIIAIVLHGRIEETERN
jgi:hypothetical protein